VIKVGVDIGNSKISCVVSDLKKNTLPKILSFINYPTSNINKNIFTNFQLIKDEVKQVITLAAKDSQTEIKSINLNIPITDSMSFFYNSKIEIENELIMELHLKKAINQSEFFDNLINYEILMNYIASYEVDKKMLFGNPIGNFAKVINLNFYKLLIKKNLINTFKNLFNNLQIHIEQLVPTPLSSALATLNDDDRDLGAICIDLGQASTSLAVFENEKLLFADAVSIGSKNITNDIARGISTTKESAERLKTLYGSVLSSPSDEHEIIEIPILPSEFGQFKQINRSTINNIIKPRVEETLELVWQKLRQYNLHKRKIKNLVLTGGGSQLEGIADYAQTIFDSNVRLGQPQGVIGLNQSFSGPQFSQTIGSILYEADKYEVNFLKKSQKMTKNTLIGRFSSWLDQYI
jgi:cell division protein FtsA